MPLYFCFDHFQGFLEARPKKCEIFCWFFEVWEDKIVLEVPKVSEVPIVFKVAKVPKIHKDKDKYIDKWKPRLIWRLDSGLGRRSCSTGFGIEVIPWRMPFPLLPVVLGWLTRLLYCTTKALERFQVFWTLHNIYIFSIGIGVCLW